ncbi:hypothetical protein [Vibrio methylphosphonaticus]|uniref:hypothetical protein n=1 Tax=Vibrio methylphosphonaticus TaxID=2946866 RepID=UPI00202A8C01|nr:hypothetical protein [Vibrio methylphosphonaticus]MCL9777544.1 hypothetical protein [Vibrio methylphosphonaticus]
MRPFLSLLLVSLLSGCAASVDITHPEPRVVENRFITDKGYDYAWTRVVDWFAEHHITIDKLDKQSGIVTAKHRLTVDNGEALCGQVVGTGTYQILSSDRTLSLNVLVREQEDNSATVQMNLNGEIVVRARNWDTGANISTRGHCVSTGKLERSLSTYVN